MARSFDGSSDYLTYASPILSAYPLTIAAWFNTDTVSGAHAIFAVGGDNGFQTFGHVIVIVGSAFWALSQDDSGNNQAISTATLSTGTWYHGCGVFAASNDRMAFINGANKGTDANFRTPALWERTRIGQRATDLADQKFDGLIAEVSVWDVALTDAEVAILGLGYSPLLVRPQNLVCYVPLIRDNDDDIVGGVAFSTTGSPTIAPHPRVFYPGNSIYVPFSGVIIGSTCWGHSTGVSEDNTRTFAANWTGTGEISGSGDAETICLNSGEYMESEVVNTGTLTVELDQNVYAAGDDILLRYRHGASEAACLAAAWNNYTVPFDSAGYVQVRIESTL